MNVGSLALGLWAGFVGVSAQAAVSLTAVTHTNFNGLSSFTPSLNDELSSTFISGASGYSDLKTGAVGAQSTNAFSTTQTVASFADELTFDMAASVSFSITLDGTLMSNSLFRHPRGQLRADIYDISGLSDWVDFIDFGLGAEILAPVDAAVNIATVSILADMEGIDTFSTSNGQATVNAPLSRDGTVHDIQFSLSDSFLVDPNKTYGVMMSISTFGGDGSASDFINTGTFAFSSLEGASYQSASGVFLSEQAAVPVPAAAWLFGSALLGLAGIKRKGVFA